jgi:hypothetical protein
MARMPSAPVTACSPRVDVMLAPVVRSGAILHHT